MRAFGAHAATDVTGFGILGHARTLAGQQRQEVAFVIHNLPVIAKMAAVSKACGARFGLLQGTAPETSGNEGGGTDPKIGWGTPVMGEGSRLGKGKRRWGGLVTLLILLGVGREARGGVVGWFLGGGCLNLGSGGE